MCGKQGGQRPVDAGHHPDRLHIGTLRQSQAAEFGRDLDPERAHLLEFVDDLLRDLALAVDLVRVDSPQQRVQALEEGPRPLLLLRIGLRIGVDQLQTQVALEQLAHEARARPFGFTRRLGDGTRFLLADLGVGLLGRCDRSGHV